MTIRLLFLLLATLVPASAHAFRCPTPDEVKLDGTAGLPGAVYMPNDPSSSLSNDPRQEVDFEWLDVRYWPWPLLPQPTPTAIFVGYTCSYRTNVPIPGSGIVRFRLTGVIGNDPVVRDSHFKVSVDPKFQRQGDTNKYRCEVSPRKCKF